MKTIKDLEKIYDIDFEKIINEINNKKSKLVLLQFAEGLKPYATAVVKFLEEKCKKTEFLIWLGNCFGACDTPILGDDLEKKIDLMIQFGHNEMMPGY